MGKKCFAFAIGGLPDPLLHPRRARITTGWINRNAFRLMGMHPVNRNETLLLFESMSDAKISRERFVAIGNPAGNNIMECEIDDDGTLIVGNVSECGQSGKK